MNKKPIIGVTPSHDTDKDDLSMRPTYMRAIRDAGAIPLIFPLEVPDDDFAQLVDLVDGMLFTGGPDVHPSYFGENTHINCGSVSPLRDKMELTILPMIMAAKKPILGICRGIQLLNTGLGGTLYQDIPSQTSPDFPLAHRQPFYYTNYSHTVTIEKGSKLEKISKGLEIQVNSMHHQAIKRPAPGLTVTAYSPDGLIEAVEKTDYPYFVGVQWHPEYLYPFDEAAGGLFKSFVDACK